jgi:hypothetical protein
MLLSEYWPHLSFEKMERLLAGYIKRCGLDG